MQEEQYIYEKAKKGVQTKRKREKHVGQNKRKVRQKEGQVESEVYRLWFYNKIFTLQRHKHKLVYSTFPVVVNFPQTDKLSSGCCLSTHPERQLSSTSFSPKQEAARCHPVSVT